MKYFNRHILIHVLIWSTIILLMVGDAILIDDESPVIDLMRISLGIIVYYINYLFLIPRIFFKKKVFVYAISAFTLAVLGGILINTLESLEFFEVFHDKDYFNERRRHGDSDPVGVVVYMMLIIIGAIIRTYSEWSKNEEYKREIENQKNISELTALKNQINPHFLFNSLNSICSLAVKKSDETEEAIIMLSELMRYMLYETKDSLVLLEKEIAYIENYVNLQKMRLANKESVTLNITGSIADQKIPPLLLISFIENAFKYGVDIHGDSNVAITIDAKGNTIVFKCVNRISSKQKDDKNSGIGLENTRKRLELLYPDNHTLSIEEKLDYFIVNLSLNLSL